jgi:hypothetical protein
MINCGPMFSGENVVREMYIRLKKGDVMKDKKIDIKNSNGDIVGVLHQYSIYSTPENATNAFFIEGYGQVIATALQNVTLEEVDVEGNICRKFVNGYAEKTDTKVAGGEMISCYVKISALIEE